MVSRRATPWLGADGSPGALLQRCLEAATAAPSVHNTQPWLFHLHRDGVDISVDPQRQLTVIDLSGREQMISVGAAMFNFRVTMLAHGWLPVQSLWPASGVDGPAGRIAPGAAVPVPRGARVLAGVIPVRHSNRAPFIDRPVPASVLADLAAAARSEGAVLGFVEPELRGGLLGLVRTAEREWTADPAYREELALWTRYLPGRRDGIPPAALDHRSIGGLVPLRELGLAVRSSQPDGERFEQAPTLAVLYAGDSPREWLRAGQALQRVLLTATARGLATTLMTQPLEIPRLRDLLADEATGRAAQAIIRFGYAQRSASPSPRRPWAEVLRVDR